VTFLRGYTKAEDNYEKTISYWRAMPDTAIEVISGSRFTQPEIVKRNTFPDYWSDDFYKCVQFYKHYKKHGFPFSCGWAEAPAFIIDIIDLFDDEIEAHNADSR